MFTPMVISGFIVVTQASSLFWYLLLFFPPGIQLKCFKKLTVAAASLKKEEAWQIVGPGEASKREKESQLANPSWKRENTKN